VRGSARQLRVSRYFLVAGTLTDCGNVFATAYISTLAGGYPASGIHDGVGTNVYLLHPTGIAVDSAGNQYVADSDGNFIKYIDTAGILS
jgi:DNA-binding beta-propeller fold protein YncE